MILYKGKIVKSEIKQKIKEQNISIVIVVDKSSSLGIVIILSFFILIFFSSPKRNNKSKNSSSKFTKFIANNIKLLKPKFPTKVKLRQKHDIIIPEILQILLKKQNIPKGTTIITKKIKAKNIIWKSLGINLFIKIIVEDGINCFKRKESYAFNDTMYLLFEKINERPNE
jgi:hypothetical protein